MNVEKTILEGLLLMVIGNVIIKLLAVSGISDKQRGPKVFAQKVAPSIFCFQTIGRFCFDLEFLFVAEIKRFSVLETFVQWIDDPNTGVKIFQGSVHTFTELFIIRWNSFIGVNRSRGSDVPSS